MKTSRKNSSFFNPDRLPPIPNLSAHAHDLAHPSPKTPHTPLPGNSFQVCDTCQKHLLDSFSHCLHRNIDYMDVKLCLPSLLDFDEEDVREVNSPPEYRVLKDPSTKLEKFDFSGRGTPNGVTRTLIQNKPHSPDHQLTHNKHSNHIDHELDPKEKISTSVFRSLLQAKNKDIAKLKQQLYEVSLREKIEHTNVEKLQTVVGKATRFYALAEDWKDLELKQLQDKIIGLKSYVGSLMSFLLNNDEYRKQLDDMILVLTTSLAKSDAIVAKNDSVVSALKTKLADAFKEFVLLSSEYNNLRENSTSIEELQESHNQVKAMAEQYQALSKDLVQVTKNYEERTLRYRQLEFECEELVRQFNALGQAHSRLTTSYDTITEEHRSKMYDFDKLKIFHAVTLRQKETADTELSTLRIAHEALTTKAYYDKEDSTDQITKQKAYIEELYGQNARLTIDLFDANKIGSEQAVKIDDLDSLLNLTNSTMATELNGRDIRIAELSGRENSIVLDRNAYRSKNDDLIMKVNELHLVIDNEASQNRGMILELKEMRNSLQQSMTNFQEESFKLNKQKDALSRDKVNLADELRETRKRLDVTDDTMEKVQEAHRDVLNEHKANFRMLDEEHNAKKEQLRDLHLAHDLYTHDLIVARALIVERNETIVSLTQTLSETTHTLLDTKDELKDLNVRYVGVIGEKEELNRQYNATMKKWQDTTRDLNTTTSKLTMAKLESSSTIKTLNQTIGDLEKQGEKNTTNLYEKRELITQQIKEIKKFKDLYDKKCDMFENERILREKIQDILGMKMIELAEERLMKDEAQKSLFQIKMDGTGLEEVGNADLLDKRTRLEHISAVLNDEKSRIEKFLDLIPITMFDVKD